jgi:hypothetical protein
LDLQDAAGQILLRQIGTAGDQAFFDVALGDDFKQSIELRYAQALANIGCQQAFAFAGGKRVCPREFDGLD